MATEIKTLAVSDDDLLALGSGERTGTLSRRIGILLMGLGPLLFAALSLLLGQDNNWDLRNYHWYNAYAFLADRWNVDIAPAGTPSFYNPALDIPVFRAAQLWPAWVIGLLLGALHGLNMSLLLALAFSLLTGLRAPWRLVAALGLAATGTLGASHLSLVGTTFHDNLGSLFVLASLLLIVTHRQSIWGDPLSRAWPWLLAAGGLAGATAGLKQPTVIYAVGLCGAFLFMGGPFRRGVGNAFAFGLGVLLGLAITGGWWMLFLWQHYANPFFPYFNDLFQSPMGLPSAYRDEHALPENWCEWLGFPFVVLLDPFQSAEVPFRDLRLPAAYLMALATAGLAAVRGLPHRLKRVPIAAPPAAPHRPPLLDPLGGRYLLAMAAVSYLAWLKMFAIYRYALTLEFLAPLLLAALLRYWPGTPARQAGFLALTCAVLLGFNQPGNWGRIAFGERFVNTEIPALPHPDRTLVVMTGVTPSAYVLPAFPPDVAFLRIHSYLVHPNHGDIGLNRLMQSRIRAHDGDFYWLVGPNELPTTELLPRYGLTADTTSCRPITSNLGEPLLFCRLSRLPTATTLTQGTLSP